MTMINQLKTIPDIKAAVDRGDDVRAGNDNYRVIKDSIGQYLIHFTGHPENWIGLHGREGTKFEGQINMSPVYVKDPQREFDVYIKLYARVKEVDAGQAFDKCMNLIENRHGMEIMNHEIIEVEHK